MALLYLLLVALTCCSNAQEDCSVFHEGACPLEESNILGMSSDIANGAECQALCKFEPSHSCNFFTFLSSASQCYLLSSCESVEECPDCISGPTQPSFSECPWPPPSTTMPPTTTTSTTTTTATSTTTTITTTTTTTTTTTKTTTTTIITTTTTTATTTTTTATTTLLPTTPSGCHDAFHPNQRCDDHDENVLDHIKHVENPEDCQAICQNIPGCLFFTHATDDHGSNGECWLHPDCSKLTNHDCDCYLKNHCNCLSGPVYPDLNDCSTASPSQLPCMDQFHPGQRCDDHDENVIDRIQHINTQSECQAICQNIASCEFFTHATDDHGNNGECWLHPQCSELTQHDCDCYKDEDGLLNHCNCFCGPKYPDLDDCGAP